MIVYGILPRKPVTDDHRVIKNFWYEEFIGVVNPTVGKEQLALGKLAKKISFSKGVVAIVVVDDSCCSVVYKEKKTALVSVNASTGMLVSCTDLEDVVTGTIPLLDYKSCLTLYGAEGYKAFYFWFDVFTVILLLLTLVIAFRGPGYLFTLGWFLVGVSATLGFTGRLVAKRSRRLAKLKFNKIESMKKS